MIFFMSNGLGDLIMATPAINQYLKVFNQNRLIIIVSKSAQVDALKFLISGNYEAYSLDRNIVKLIKIYLRIIFSKGPLVAPLLSSKPRSLLMLCLFAKKIFTNSKAAFSIPWLVTRLDINMYQKGIHQVNYCINFLSKTFNVKFSEISNMPLLFERDKSMPNSIKVIALGISSGFLERHKIPSPEYFANFVNQLSIFKKCHFLLISTKSDSDVVNKFLAKINSDILITELRDLNLEDLIRVIKNADLCISGTTGQGHIFSTCNIPMLVFGGVTDPNLSGPFVKDVIAVCHDYPCGPCYNEKYRFGCGRNCMDSIDINKVVHHALNLLDVSSVT